MQSQSDTGALKRTDTHIHARCVNHDYLNMTCSGGTARTVAQDWMTRKTLERIYRELGEVLEEHESYLRMKKLLETPLIDEDELKILIDAVGRKEE